MDALRDESDRSAAIVAASLLESTLEKILIASMSEKDAKLIGQLFENRGPLSDFNGKILVAVAFGVISPKMGEHFQSIRHIRNAFAHARTPITFETPQVAKEIESFGMLQAMREVMLEQQRRRGTKETVEEPLPTMRGKGGYLLTVTVILIMLDQQHHRKGLGKLYDDCHPATPAST